MPELIPITLLVRDLEALRAVCRRRGWEFREGQRHYRWFGRWLGDQPLPPGVAAAELGHCVHAVGFPGCAYEMGLLRRGDHWLPVWDDTPEGGLAALLGPDGGRFWQAYVTEVVRRAARRRRQRVGRHVDLLGTLRLRLTARGAAAPAHVRVAGNGAATLWLFGPGSGEFRYLADLLGSPRSDEITILDADPAGPSPVAVPS